MKWPVRVGRGASAPASTLLRDVRLVVSKLCGPIVGYFQLDCTSLWGKWSHPVSDCESHKDCHFEFRNRSGRAKVIRVQRKDLPFCFL